MPALETKVVWSKGAWERRDYATIMSGPVVRYTVGYEKANSAFCEVSASRDMLCVGSTIVRSEESRAELLDILERAWRQHLHLKQSRKETLEEL